MIAALFLSAMLAGQAEDPFVMALQGAWSASAREDGKAFAALVAPNAVFKIGTGEEQMFTVASLRDYAKRCRFLKAPEFSHPEKPSPEPYTAWASAKLACDGKENFDYALTIWFDGNGKISDGHLMAPVKVVG